MIYIYEGPDGCGKSTRANLLSKKLFIYCLHNCVVPKNELELNCLIEHEQLLLLNCERLILDRSQIISEFVYGRVFERKFILPEDTLKVFKNTNITLNIMNADKPLLLGNDVNLPIEKIKKEYDNLKEILKSYNINYNNIDIKDDWRNLNEAE